LYDDVSPSIAEPRKESSKFGDGGTDESSPRGRAYLRPQNLSKLFPGYGAMTLDYKIGES
jgi:hypothetical protein